MSLVLKMLAPLKNKVKCVISHLTLFSSILIYDFKYLKNSSETSSSLAAAKTNTWSEPSIIFNITSGTANFNDRSNNRIK